MKAEPVVVERTLQAPVAKVWKALTDPRQVKSWYFDIDTFKAEPGFEFTFYGGDAEKQWMHYCKVLEAVKEKKLSYTWSYHDEFPGIETVVTWELFPEDANSTRVRITHAGLEKFPQDSKNFRKESFVEGWTFILGTNLTDYVEKFFIEHTLDLPASLEKVWSIVTDKEMIKRWARAFHEGTYVESDWQPGHVVVWKGGDGSIGAKGVVVTNEPGRLLRVAFYDDLNMEPPAQPGKYTETYKIEPQNGHSRLLISCGPLANEDAAIHGPMWEKALAYVKELAEQP
jgi:uncharacterized protein YndB with AHSA1/START domain